MGLEGRGIYEINNILEGVIIYKKYTRTSSNMQAIKRHLALQFNGLVTSNEIQHHKKVFKIYKPIKKPWMIKSTFCLAELKAVYLLQMKKYKNIHHLLKKILKLSVRICSHKTNKGILLISSPADQCKNLGRRKLVYFKNVFTWLK